MFRIKICGITNPADALAAAEAGADAIGLNFCPASKRCIGLQQAEKIIAALPRHVAKVGVFANADPADVLRAIEQLRLDSIQFHGGEPVGYLLRLGGAASAIQAFACGPAGHEKVLEFLAECRRAGIIQPAMVLLDAATPGQLGGTGQVADWAAAHAYAAESGVPPLVLAGGLTPENVAEAIRQVRPAAVDTASGVESSPGVKDHAKIARFVVAARAAFAEIATVG